MKKIIDKIFLIIKSEGFIYLVVGGITTLVNLVVYAVLYNLLKIDVTISNIISVTISILFAYVANKIVVFKSKTHNVKETIIEMAKFCGARISTMIIEVGGVFFMYNILKIHKKKKKIATQIIVIIVNYFISKFFVFKGNKSNNK